MTIKGGGRWVWRLMEKTILNFHFDYLHPSLIITLFSQHFRSLPVPGHSQEWRPLIPFPNFGNGFFSFPSRSRISGMDFFHSLPVPEFWEWIFSFPSCSRISGMDFFHSLPVPDFGNGFFLFPFRSQISGIGFFNSFLVSESSKVIPAHPWTGTSNKATFPEKYGTWFWLKLQKNCKKKQHFWKKIW